jgi:signal peptidase I
MTKKKTTTGRKPEKSAFRETVESLLFALGIALLLRATVIYPYTIPTPSMEGSLMVGDYLLANKFVYGIRTPDWIGIPYTRIGFHIPFTRTPGFRKPAQGDVVIFKYPRDPYDTYVKRCIGVSGDTVHLVDKVVYVNGKIVPNAPEAQHLEDLFPVGKQQPGIFPPGAGNIHNFGPIRIPAPGDTYRFYDNDRSAWFERFQVIVYEGRHLTRQHGKDQVRLTVNNQDRWPVWIRETPIDHFTLEDEPLDEAVYTVKYRHYFFLGDNRDISLDSRFWGAVPERFIVGEGLIVLASWDKDIPFYRLTRKVRWDRTLKLIR